MKYISTLLIWFCLPIIVIAQEVKNHDSITVKNGFKFPSSLGWVSDFENILTKKEEKKLNKIIKNFERKTSNEICLVTIESIYPYDNIADFTTDLSNTWRVGKKYKDNGLTIIHSKNLREVRIGTGLGTEKILTDNICKNIIDHSMIPEFKKGNYYKGLKKGIKALVNKWE